MKKQTILLAVIASLFGLSTSGFAQEGPGPSGPDDGGHYALRPDGRDRPPAPHRDWHRGEPVPPAYRGSQYVVDDWPAYELQPPPPGYQWLRVNGDFVLAAVTTGVITSIVLAPPP